MDIKIVILIRVPDHIFGSVKQLFGMQAMSTYYALAAAAGVPTLFRLAYYF